MQASGSCIELSGRAVLCDWWTTLRWTVRRALPHTRRRRLRAKRSAGGSLGSSPDGSPSRCGPCGLQGRERRGARGPLHMRPLRGWRARSRCPPCAAMRSQAAV